ncbi:MAG: hypothetical protein FJ137_10320 [Deltaproteobacteria bacterium]|nr:hypothetical protein [Deltaproteobacteria bacterium]
MIRPLRPLTPLFALPVALAVGAGGCHSDRVIDLDVDRSRRSATLRHYESCDALAADLRSNVRERLRTQLLQERELLRDGGYVHLTVDDSREAAAGDGGARDGGARDGRQEGVDFSGTNNQESGVDEADLVKTDGYFLYTLNGDRLEILGVPEFGQLTAVSSTSLEGYPTQLLLDGDRAVVFSTIYAYDAAAVDGALAAVLLDEEGTPHGQTLTKVTVLALGRDRVAPTVEKELYLEGSLLTARRIGDVVRLANYGWFDVPGLRSWLDVPASVWDTLTPEFQRHAAIDEAFFAALAENDRVLAATDVDHFVPRLFEKQGGRLGELGLRAGSCDNVAIPEDGMAYGFTSLLTLGLGDPGVSVEADHVVTNFPILYASTDTLLLAEPAQDWWWYWGNEDFEEATNIHRFTLDGATTTYSGSGRVGGTLLGQFALDEHDGVVRVAATKGQWGRWWQENPAPPVTHVVTLGGERALSVLGSVDGIAPDERLWSVRFTDTEAYLVTFRNIDPLWTIDLSDATNPRVLGELHVPGVSTYIHPLGDHLLTIGLAGDDEGLDWGTTQLSLFDITDRTTPTLESSLPLTLGQGADGWQYGSSEATYEHKAFSYWGPQAQVAVPLSTWRYSERDGYEYKTELVLAHAEPGQPLAIDGRIDHSGFYNVDRDAWWDYRDVRRSIFMGDYVYAISDKGVSCTRLSDLALTASVVLRGFNDR